MLLVHWALNLMANGRNLFVQGSEDCKRPFKDKVKTSLFKVQKTVEGLLEHYSGEFLHPCP